MVLKVSVKWQKETFGDLEVDTDQPPAVFKAQLFALTGVPPDRQKIMVKGGVLQDDADWAKVAIKNGQRLMMMGTADAAPVAPAQAPVFVEDLPEEEQEAASSKDWSAGLVNLGNTCYMNATVQCLHSVPQLKSALTLYDSTSGVDADNSHRLALAARDLFTELDKARRPVTPLRFLMLLRQRFPQFAQQGEHGAYMQQDAEECWTQFLFSLSQRLRNVQSPSQGEVDNIFGITFASKVKCTESGEESEESETAFMLKCHISTEVNLLHEGIKRGLSTELEKVSPALGRSAVFVRESLITRLPTYLTVQFVRFFWKRESQQKAKILRRVTYPLVLDVYDFCTAELKAKLDAPRKRYRLADDIKAGLIDPNAKGKEKEGEGGVEKAGAMEVEGKEGAEAAGGEVKEGATAADGQAKEAGQGGMEVDGAADDKAASSSDPAPATSASPSDSQGELTGVYDLAAVLTHKGRSADSGHYVAWVKQQNGSWIEFDDDQPIMRKEEEIINLAGGGDWHMAYILLYKARTA
eukprot:TRINITY_DN12104_c0_g1_i1.p1 TRINITY_DN12104_c0_g1~~TRINITY_DN12104_c0_g1_i1.p1  ORF type:complete len:524 (-),score=61.62 TRINITY_DN12104_c0_g1_i1:91-1662(-)